MIRQSSRKLNARRRAAGTYRSAVSCQHTSTSLKLSNVNKNEQLYSKVIKRKQQLKACNKSLKKIFYKKNLPKCERNFIVIICQMSAA